MHNFVSKRGFLKTLGLFTSGSLMFGAVEPLLAKAQKKLSYRLSPIPGVSYSPGFLRLCQKRRFASAIDAVKSIRNERQEFIVTKV